MRKNELLSERQYGFTPQKSTLDAINNVINLAKRQLKLKQFLLIISLDIKGAFDNAFWSYILYQLFIKNTPKNLYGLIRSYLSDREVILIINDLMANKSIDRGCGQGSACAPGLCNILFDELLQLALPPNSISEYHQ
jgi:retron-type reverse transcriptase